MIVMLAGLPATGKSTLARALSGRLHGAVLDKDVIRAALFPAPLIEYSAAQDDFCQEMILQTAAYLLEKHASLNLFLDGRTFSRRYQRERVIRFCNQLGVPCAIVECVCKEETALARLRLALAEGSHPAANRTPELYLQIRTTWEPVEDPKLVVDTDDSFENCTVRALRYLARFFPATATPTKESAQP